MTRYVLRRLGLALVLSWAVATATFFVTAVVPGDPARLLTGPHADDATVQQVRTERCLDRPVLARYRCYLLGLARGDLGRSFRTDEPVLRTLASKLWPTTQLAGAAILLQLLLGVSIGTLAATRGEGSLAKVLRASAVVTQSVPAFVLGFALVYLCGYRLGWLPVGGYGSSGLDRLRHLVLPATTLALAGCAAYAEIVRTGLGNVLRTPFIRTARAKGLVERRVVLGHGLPNAALPVVTLLGMDLGALLGGSVAIEYMFSWPGIGREAFLSVLNLDIPILVAIVQLGALTVIVTNLLTDLACAALDPRVRLE